MSKCYFTYHVRDNIIWGAARTKGASTKDAKRVIEDWNGGKKLENKVAPKPLKTVPCSEETYEWIRENGTDEYTKWEKGDNGLFRVII